jgi:hypothetical protein
MVQWIWRHISFRLPAEWEMLQFSTEYPQGRCAFADRYQFRFEMNWSSVKGEPDYDRMISDYTSKLEREKKLTDPERLKKSGWFGFYGVLSGDHTSRFGRYFAPIGCLLECVFIWPEERDPELEAAVLASIEAMPADTSGNQRWRAFGLDMALPPIAALEGCTAQPARAQFSFSNPKTGSEWSFERLGMTASWLKHDLETWLRGHIDPSVNELRITHATRHGSDVVRAEGTYKPAGLHLKRGRLNAEAWLCPEDGRLYYVCSRIRGHDPSDARPIEHLLTAAPDFTPRPPPP